MSRIGKQPISIPSNTTVQIKDGCVTIKGPKGELSRSFPPVVDIRADSDKIEVTLKKEGDSAEAMWGTVRAIIANMVTGVNDGFSKVLEVQGVGYKVKAQGKNLVLEVGFSHPVDVKIPDGIDAAINKNEITISGIDREQVGQVAAEIRKIRKPEPYKGKGIRYKDEHVRRKAGKVVKGAE